MGDRLLGTPADAAQEAADTIMMLAHSIEMPDALGNPSSGQDIVPKSKGFFAEGENRGQMPLQLEG
jgi:hypothetical protein